MIRLIPMSFLLLFVTIACSTTKQSTAGSLSLLDTKWEAEQVNGVAVKLENNSAYFILQSGENPQMIGNTSCNGMSGPYKLAGDTLTFSNVMSTRRGCMGNSIEPEFMSVLARTTHYRIVKNKLILTDGETAIAILKPVE